MRTIRLYLLLVRANAQYNITAMENPQPFFFSGQFSGMFVSLDSFICPCVEMI